MLTRPLTNVERCVNEKKLERNFAEADGHHVNGEDGRRRADAPPPPTGCLMVRTDLGGMTLASALRGAPLTSGAAIQELGIRPFAARNSAAGPEPFSPTHRLLPGGSL